MVRDIPVTYVIYFAHAQRHSSDRRKYFLRGCESNFAHTNTRASRDFCGDRAGSVQLLVVEWAGELLVLELVVLFPGACALSAGSSRIRPIMPPSSCSRRWQ